MLLIIGASSGFGRLAAKLAAEQGCRCRKAFSTCRSTTCAASGKSTS
jgi:NAD(P)-dependent dehydrogenase (short-subunit alcohol dehydrogenase family)